MPALFAQFSQSAVPAAVRKQLELLLSNWQKRATGERFTFASFVTFAREFVAAAMAIVNSLSDNATKKAVVLKTAGALFDVFQPYIAIGLARWPWAYGILWLLGLTGPTAKDTFLVAIGWMIEAIYEREIKPARKARLI